MKKEGKKKRFFLFLYGVLLQGEQEDIFFSCAIFFTLVKYISRLLLSLIEFNLNLTFFT